MKCQWMLYSISKFSLKIGTIWKHIVLFRNAIVCVKELKNADSRTRKLIEDRLVIFALAHDVSKNMNWIRIVFTGAVREPCTASSLLESAGVIPLPSLKLIHEGQGKIWLLLYKVLYLWLSILCEVCWASLFLHTVLLYHFYLSPWHMITFYN